MILLWVVAVYAAMWVIKQLVKFVRGILAYYHDEPQAPRVPKHQHDYTPWEELRDKEGDLLPIQRKMCRVCFRKVYEMF